jgi:serine/threonine-protein kinase
METVGSDPDISLQRSMSLLNQLQPGQMLGQYRILERLGAGGMGHVYKAIHPAMGRLVALKIIAPRLMLEPSARARFQREVRNAARLLHPNVVVAYDAAEVQGLWFLVMEYVDGKDVSSLLYRQGRPPVALACEIIRQAAVGLQYAHELGMVHRDIKPANLIVTSARPMPTGESATDGWMVAPLVKILDFGLSRLAASDGDGLSAGDAVTSEGTIVGTPEYMAPEQARDSRLVDIRGDIYSLGCTLYTLLSGRPPFRAASSFEIAVLHLTQPPEPITRYCPDLPPDLSAAVHRMLAKKPEDRYQTPGEVAVALQPWAQLAAAPTPVPAVLKPAVVLDPAAYSSDPILVTTAHPPAPAATPTPTPKPAAPARLIEPEIPPGVVEMHMQALLRTVLLVIVIVAIIVGCFLGLEAVGDRVLKLLPWSGAHPTQKAPAPRR